MEPWSDFRLAIAAMTSLRTPQTQFTRLRRFLPSNPWKILAILFALLNLKSLPFVWHLRLLNGLLLQTLTSRRRVTHHSGPLPLFAPIITTTRTSLLECDYNLHKSNSSYFSDFDVGRLHLLVALLGHGVSVMSKELAVEGRGGSKGGFYVALGGVAVNFRREIKPLQKVECWTRVLGWDGKWLYVVGHFVRCGSVRVGGQVLGGRKQGEWWGAGRKGVEKGKGEGEGETERPPVVYASAIAKYVCKKGRVTVPPERVLRASKLLPERPEGEVGNEDEEVEKVERMNGDGDGNGVAVDGVAAMPAAEAVLDSMRPETAEDMIGASVLSADNNDDVWDWARVEKERLRGMRVAQVYSNLNGLSAEAPKHGSMVLGQY